MRPIGPMTVSTKQKLLLLGPSLLGVALILLFTYRWGIGLYPDSIAYVATARHLVSGDGFITFTGSPMLRWPPLYPALLALVGFAFDKDPLLLAHFLNAVLFGLTIYLGGLLALKHLSSSPAFVVAGMLAIVFSRPLLNVSTMAWSELPFILFTLLSLLLADLYLARRDVTSLLLFSTPVALAFLTRYVGITLLAWGALVVLLYPRHSLKKRIWHSALFTLVSAFPPGLWLARNYALSGTLTGHRVPSDQTLVTNITLALSHLIHWYVPERVTHNVAFALPLGAALVLLAALGARRNWRRLKHVARRTSPIFLFTVIFAGFLVVTSTIIAYDPIDDRLLSPIYIPVTLLLLIGAEVLTEPYRERFSGKATAVALAILVLAVAAVAAGPAVREAKKVFSQGRGYASREWRESATVRYLVRHRAAMSDCTWYTNDLQAAYILADLAARTVPPKWIYSPPRAIHGIAKLKGNWPEENDACIVWFDRTERDYLFTIDELGEIATLHVIARLDDGAIYSVTRK